MWGRTSRTGSRKSHNNRRKDKKGLSQSQKRGGVKKVEERRKRGGIAERSFLVGHRSGVW